MGEWYLNVCVSNAVMVCYRSVWKMSKADFKDSLVNSFWHTADVSFSIQKYFILQVPKNGLCSVKWYNSLTLYCVIFGNNLFESEFSWKKLCPLLQNPCCFDVGFTCLSSAVIVKVIIIIVKSILLEVYMYNLLLWNAGALLNGQKTQIVVLVHSLVSAWKWRISLIWLPASVSRMFMFTRGIVNTSLSSLT